MPPYTILVACALLLVGCKQGTAAEPSDAQTTSPQASAIPAPFAFPLVATVNVSAEGGPPPVPMRGDVELEPESAGKDSPGYSLSVVVRLPDAPAVPVGPPINVAAVDALRKQNEPRFTVDLSPNRMRMQLSSPGFFLPRDAELRSRTDRYGHVFLAPDLVSYRVLAPGSLRALFAERRMDVSPLSPAEVVSRGDGLVRLGYHTRKVEVQGRAGKGVFEIVRLADLGDGGTLFLRAWLDLMSVAPQTVVLSADELPLHGELHWPTRGAIFFDVTSIAKRPDLAATSLTVPPTGATFTIGPLPPTAGELRVDPKDLAAIHAATPETGTIALVNEHDTPRFAWIDGAPIGWVAPEARLETPPLPRGHYQLDWRSFLDDAADGPTTVSVPPTLNRDGGQP